MDGLRQEVCFFEVAPRVVPFADKYRLRPTWHPAALVNDPNEVATPRPTRDSSSPLRSNIVDVALGISISRTSALRPANYLGSKGPKI